MATWTRFTYGARPWRQAMYWVPSDDVDPSVNPLRPCLIYCPGHGWEGRHPNYFYNSAVETSEALFSGHIEPDELTNEVVCISIWQASANYDLYDVFTHTGWTLGAGAISEGDIFGQPDPGPITAIWLCRKAHTAAADKEPGVGALSAFYWIELDKNDARGLVFRGRTGEDHALAPGMSPAFGATGIRDVHACVQYVKSRAAFFGIDPNKIVLMGSSAGGQASGSAAYSKSAPFHGADSAELFPRYSARDSSRVMATVLDITPNDFKWFAWSSLMSNLFGLNLSTFWVNDVSDAVKSGLTPLGVLNATQLAIPTYLAYAGSRFDHTGGTDDPPYVDAQFHHARNGWEILKALNALGEVQTVFLEDSATPGFFERWTTPTASTEIADTDRALDIWTWLKSPAVWNL